jgi:hypothetical protein
MLLYYNQFNIHKELYLECQKLQDSSFQIADSLKIYI